MTGLHYRSAYAFGALLVGLAAALLPPGDARADAAPAEPDVRASMQCDRATEPGRVRCTVEVRVEGGQTLAWADVEITSLPDFASALKGRIGPQDALARDGVSTKWGLALIARRAGQGEARARVRVVVCPAGGASPSRCAPRTIEVKATLSVSA